METPAWLRGICSTDRPALTLPMVIERGSLAYTVATDGHRIVELPGMYDDAAFPGKEMRENLARLLPPMPAAFPSFVLPFNFNEFRQFIIDELADTIRSCDECESSGQVVYFTRKGEGPNFARCPKCDGAVARAKKVYIGGVLFDAKLFEAFVINLPDTWRATWYQTGSEAIAVVEGPSWRFGVMPMRDDLEVADRAKLAHFAIEGAEWWRAA